MQAPMMPSEKAKGKQRAVEPEDVKPPTRSLVIRFTEGVPDLTINVGEKDTVRDVKRNIRDARTQLKDRRLRLIHSGRLLTDGTLLYSWLSSLEERQHRAVSDIEVPPQPSAHTTWLHCSVGPPMSETENEEEVKVQTAQLKPLRGFDRLAAAGFSERDIANFRMQFHAHSAGDYLDQTFASEEDFDEHARALEEQWIDSLDSAGSAALSQSSSRDTYTLLRGVVLGFFFPLLPFFFFHKPKPAVFWADGREHGTAGDAVFSGRLQMGIVVGFVMNVVFGMWTYLLAAP